MQELFAQRYIPGGDMGLDIIALYVTLKEEEMLPSLFWQYGRELSCTEFHTAFMDSEKRPLWILHDCAGETRSVGCIFADSIEPYRAMVSIAVSRLYRGEMCEQTCRKMIPRLFRELGTRSLWTATPHFGAKVLCQRLGFERMATLPDFAHVDGNLRDVDFWRIKRFG